MHTFKKLPLFLFCVLLLSSHAVFAITNEELEAIGNSTNIQILETNGEFEDPAFNQYFQKVIKKIMKNNPALVQKNYQFKILDNYEFNAFAVPPRFVYINKGLLYYLNSEAELMAVIGHEIGHLEKEHVRHQIEGQDTANVFSGLVGGIAGVSSILLTGNDYLSGVAYNITHTAGTFSNMHFSRENEFESDAYGAEILQNCGYSAFYAYVVQNKMRLLFESQAGNANQADFFASHPPSLERGDKLKDHFQIDINQSPQSDTGYLSLLAQIPLGRNQNDGLLFEKNYYLPSQGLAFLAPGTHSYYGKGTKPLVFFSGNEYENILVMKKKANPRVSLAKAASAWVMDYFQIKEKPSNLEVYPKRVGALTGVEIILKDEKELNGFFFIRNNQLVGMLYIKGGDSGDSANNANNSRAISFDQWIKSIQFFTPRIVKNHTVGLLTIKKNESLDDLVTRAIMANNLYRKKIKPILPSHQIKLLGVKNKTDREDMTAMIQQFNLGSKFLPGELIKIPILVGYSL
jgi:hypothetical protein